MTHSSKVIVCKHFEYQDDIRLAEATKTWNAAVRKLLIYPLSIYYTDQYIKFIEILEMARKYTNHSFFVWSNTDVILTKDPFEGLQEGVNYGFHRTEIPSGEVCKGIDMYRIDNDLWDNVLSKDVPDLWLGGTHIDWWLSRACQKYGQYENLTGYIDHPSHERTPTSAGSDERGQHNIKEYNEWADRHNISKT